MTVYYANFYANNGTRWRHPITDTNLKRIIKDVRSSAEAERFLGNDCRWSVWIDDGGNYPKYVAAGGYNACGGRYRVSDRDLPYL